MLFWLTALRAGLAVTAIHAAPESGFRRNLPRVRGSHLELGFPSRSGSGAFYNSNAAVGVGVNDPQIAQINASSDRARVFILILELAHLTGAAGFENDAGNQPAGNRNNDRVCDNCSATLTRFSNRGR